MNFDNKRFEYITCAAVWIDDGIIRVHQPKNIKSGIVVAGHRHCNCFVILKDIFKSREYIGKEVQGFLTSKGRFVDREMASVIAFNANQTEVERETLYSEDIY